MKSTNKEKKLSPRKRLFTSGSEGDVVTFTFVEIFLVFSVPNERYNTRISRTRLSSARS